MLDRIHSGNDLRTRFVRRRAVNFWNYVEVSRHINLSQPHPCSVICSLYEVQDRLWRKARADFRAQPPVQLSLVPALSFPQTRFEQQESNIQADINFRPFAHEVFRVHIYYRTQRQ